MIISATATQYHKNGVRISRALYVEIMDNAQARCEATRQDNACKHGRNVHYISGMSANVYAFVNKAGEADWAEEYLKAGLIDSLSEYKGH